jgi:hypothetical protein
LFFVSLCYCIQSVIPLFSLINQDKWYQSVILFIYFSSRISPTRSGYKTLRLELVEPLQDQPHRAQRKPTREKKKYDGARHPFKMFLEEVLVQQRNKMMENFAHILRRLPTGDTSSSSGHAMPFKVQVNFDIPLFEGLIDVYAIDKWLNLLKGYFPVHNFSDRGNITFVLLKVILHVKDSWDTYSYKRAIEESAIFAVPPTWDSFGDSIKEKYYPVEGYKDQYKRWTMLRQERDHKVPDFTNIFHTLCTKLGIKGSKQHLVLKPWFSA